MIYIEIDYLWDKEWKEEFSEDSDKYCGTNGHESVFFHLNN
jgi:hypothetical protein